MNAIYVENGIVLSVINLIKDTHANNGSIN